MPYFGFLDDGATMTDLWRQEPERMLLLSKYTEHVMRAVSPLSRAERETIAAFVSGLNQCRYCHGAHVAFAEAHGVDADLLGALIDDLDGARVDERMKAILRYCRKLTLEPHRLTQRDADGVFAAGVPERALADAIHVTALFNLYNRLMDGHGFEARPADVLCARAAFIREHGYDFSSYPGGVKP